MNLWTITWRYSNRADHVSVETAGTANWLHECLHGDHRNKYVSGNLLSVIGEPVDGGKGWEWLNPEADYHPAHARNSVDAGAQGV